MPLGDASARSRNQAHDRESGYALAAAALANQPDLFARFDGEINAAHGVDNAYMSAELDVEVLRLHRNGRELGSQS